MGHTANVESKIDFRLDEESLLVLIDPPVCKIENT